jgi:hypothetical protein
LIAGEDILTTDPAVRRRAGKERGDVEVLKKAGAADGAGQA